MYRGNSREVEIGVGGATGCESNFDIESKDGKLGYGLWNKLSGMTLLL